MSQSTAKSKNRKNNKKINEYVALQIFSLVLYVFITLVTSAICLYIDLSKGSTYYVSLIVYAVSSFMIAFISGIKNRKNGLFTGVLSSLPMNLIVIIVSFIFNGFSADLRTILTLFILVFVSAAGGVLSVNTKVRK